jgi:DNA gyrase subunit B
MYNRRMDKKEQMQKLLEETYKIQVKVEDAEKADAIFNKLMGTEVELRKNFITANAKFVKDLDI